MDLLKQVVGIDCAQKELVCCFGELTQGLDIHRKASKTVENTDQGISRLTRWADRLADIEPIFVVEATGVYHQRLVYELHRQGRKVVVVLPSRASKFAETLPVRTVTDGTAARALMQMGLEKKLDLWTPPHPLFSQLKQLTRERKRLKDEVAQDTLGGMLERMNERLQLAKEHIKTIEQEIKTLIAENKGLSQQFAYVCSIKGVGLMTAAAVVSEANGFNMVRNAGQLVSYAGYDVVEKQSGTSVRGKPRISKKGNSYIRRALYFPAITAVTYNKRLGGFYKRLYKKHSIKMKAYTAVQRKLLILIYTLWTKQEMYDPAYENKKVEQPEGLPHAS